ncbi:protein-disulfide isomerase [Agromyces terreus]|uniref:Protein-disulfide isomerase n=1 Tax=Agromyces terreus TaxID=424795 RepID=A0A9X2KFS7_9MICO|nr:thioredoxin domain-containing protein [Agromyces terreus]MCP2372087.1 protein-disulfide isomerase [Agromyces terreus]
MTRATSSARFRDAGRVLVVGGALAALLLLVGCAPNGGGATHDDAPSTATGADLPTGVEGAAHFDDFALVSGDGAIDVQVWVDPLCPICKGFEEAAGDGIAALVDDGSITYSIHPMNFLDRLSNGTRYSSRADSALACVAVAQPEALLDAVAAVYDAQPAEGSDGLTNDELTAVLEGAGAAGVDDCVSAETYTAWAQASNDAAIGGIEGADIPAVQGTPTLVVNGTAYTGDVADGDAILAFIAAGGRG